MTTEKRIACIDCKYCEYKPLSEEEKEKYYQADQKYYDSIKDLPYEERGHRLIYRKNASMLIRMQEYTCLHYKRESFDNLSGKIHISVGIDCKTYRDDPFIGHCGTNAKFFEPKNKVIPIVSQPKVVEPKKPLTPPPTTERIKTRSYEWFKTFWK